MNMRSLYSTVIVATIISTIVNIMYKSSTSWLNLTNNQKIISKWGHLNIQIRSRLARDKETLHGTRRGNTCWKKYALLLKPMLTRIFSSGSGTLNNCLNESWKIEIKTRNKYLIFLIDHIPNNCNNKYWQRRRKCSWVFWIFRDCWSDGW